MELNKVWKKVKRASMPEGRRCVKHKWVFDIKRSGIFRARLVACGYSQVAGVDFTQVFSPVCNDVTFRVVLVCMIVWGLDALIFDVVTTFLTGNLEEEIYMECPEGLEHEDDEILQLLKAIYGLVQASRQYNKKFTSILKTIGFAQCRVDPCLFIRRNDLGTVIVLTYVDDNFCIGEEKALKQMPKEVVEEGLKITVEEVLTDYLSCEIRLDPSKQKAWIGQPHMVKKIIKTFEEEVNKRSYVDTPGTPGSSLIKEIDDDKKIPQELQS
jgi:Reverse transcriptase (RNA-dependent DNA polymerase)